MASLQQNPKIYCVWEHRKWVLETMPDADWGWEIKMVEMYLEKDARNCTPRVLPRARLALTHAFPCTSSQLGLSPILDVFHPCPPARSLATSFPTSASTNNRVRTRLYDAQDLGQL
jgi:hypothetical protein